MFQNRSVSYGQDIQNSYRNREKCGDYCKNLSGQEQREIIQKNILEENGCLINKANKGKIGEKKYLISANWWREWCDYVNFDAGVATN